MEAEKSYKYFSIGLSAAGVLQLILGVIVFSILSEGISSSEESLVLLAIVLSISLLTIGIGLFAYYRPEPGWHIGMAYSAFMCILNPIQLLFFSVILLLGWTGKEAREDFQGQKETVTENREVEETDIDIEEAFETALEDMEEAQDLEEKSEQVSKEQEIIENFGEKAGKAGIKETKLETYADSIISEASHVKKETLMKEVDSTSPVAKSKEVQKTNKSGKELKKEKNRYRGRTKKNAFIGLVVTLISYVTIITAAGAPFIGAFVGGFLQREGLKGGLKVGALQSAFMVLPALLIGLFGSQLIAQAPLIGPLIAGAGTTVIILFMFSHSIFIGLIGGLFGGIQRLIWDAMWN